jgi:hypothetical protein
VLFSQCIGRIKSEITRVAALGPRASVVWVTEKQSLGQKVNIELEVAENKPVYGEPRRTASAPGGEAVRTWHQQRRLRVLCKVFSRAPAVSSTDRGSPYLQSAQEICERIAARLTSNATNIALVAGECSYQGETSITPVPYSEDGRRVDTAVAELVFTYAGADTDGGEGEGAIESVDVTSNLEDVDGTEPAEKWDDHTIARP